MLVDKDELIAIRNRLPVIIIVLVALHLVNILAFRFPNATELLIGQFAIGNAIKTGTSVIMLMLVMPLKQHLETLIGYYMSRGYKVDKYADRRNIWRNINELSRGLSNIVILVIAWIVVLHLINQLLLIEGSDSLNWIDIIVHVSFALFLIYILFVIFSSLPALFSISDNKSKPITRPLRCTKCGKENRRDAKFCENCGNYLAGNEPDI